MSDLTLYQISDLFNQDFATLQASNCDEQTFNDTLEAISGDFESKSIAVVMWSQNLMAVANGIDDAVSRMMDRSATIKKQVEQLKKYQLECMQKTGISKVECDHFVISVRNNPESVIVDFEDSISDEYMVFPDIPKPVPDKKKIKAAIQAGIVIAGVHLERKQSLQIK